MAKYRLFAPGPTPVPESVRLRMARAIVHHRTPAFKATLERVLAGLKWAFQTEQDVLCLQGTGTAGMEAAVSNFMSRGDTAIYVNGGKFGERWGKILRAFGCNAVEVEVQLPTKAGGHRAVTVHLPTTESYGPGDEIQLALVPDYASVVRNSCELLGFSPQVAE